MLSLQSGERQSQRKRCSGIGTSFERFTACTVSVLVAKHLSMSSTGLSGACSLSPVPGPAVPPDLPCTASRWMGWRAR